LQAFCTMPARRAESQAVFVFAKNEATFS